MVELLSGNRGGGGCGGGDGQGYGAGGHGKDDDGHHDRSRAADAYDVGCSDAEHMMIDPSIATSV